MALFNTEVNFMGREGFRWFAAVCEDRRDPKKLGRIRVRVLAWHTEDKTLIPTSDLHWAWLYQPSTSQAMNGLGFSPTGPAEGSWVFGFFRDSDSGQEPVILGTMGGIPQEGAKPTIGFNDPSEPFHQISTIAPRKHYYRYYPNDGTGAVVKNEKEAKLYPRTTHPWGCVVGEPDTNRLARGEMLDDTVIGVQRRQRDVNIPIAFAHVKPSRQWCEPPSPAAPVYPYNHVHETESGHITEFDDTPGHERIRIMHKSGTFIEVTGDPGMEGDVSIKVVGKHFQVVMENSYQHYQNACNITIDGECNIYCRSDVNMQVDGNMKLHVKGNLEEKIHGNRSVHIDGTDETLVKGNQRLHVGGNQEMLAKGNVKLHGGGSISESAGGSINQSAGGPFHMAAGGTLSGDAPAIHWNTGFGGPQGPISPTAPVVPPFPDPLGRLETINKSGPDPVPEEKPDPDQPRAPGQKDDPA